MGVYIGSSLLGPMQELDILQTNNFTKLWYFHNLTKKDISTIQQKRFFFHFKIIDYLIS